MAHNIILFERTKQELGVELDEKITATEAVADLRTVFIKCGNCGEEFIRPLRLFYAPHACRPRPCGTYHDHPNKLPRLECKLVHKLAKFPARKRATDAGYDLFSVKRVVIWPFTTRPVPTGIKLVCPAGFYYTIEGRSGLRKKGIMPYRGIIDAGYTGDTSVFMTNASSRKHVVEVGHKIAQVLLHRVNDFDIVPVPADQDFSPEYVIRGEEGFGSSGK